MADTAAGVAELARVRLRGHWAGKSQTVRNLLEQATMAGIPWLVIEPAKAEYSHGMAAWLQDNAEVIRIRPGEADQAAAGINPLEPAAWADGTRFPLQTHADLVKSLFLAAFEADESFPQVLNAALTKVYDEYGWDLVPGEPKTPGTRPVYPGLEDLQTAADQVVREAVALNRLGVGSFRGLVAAAFLVRAFPQWAICRHADGRALRRS